MILEHSDDCIFMPPVIDFLGSKRLLLSFIINNVNSAVGNGRKDIADIFSGTGVVSAAFKANGYTVSANDHLATCFHLTSACLLNNQAPLFSGLAPSITGLLANPYLSVILFLNKIEAKTGGFVYRSYSPASANYLGYERRYFTETNAARIDTIRSKIAEWQSLLSPAEYSLLLSDLLRAVNSVSNVAGTYGCYLKQWKPRSLGALELKASVFISGYSDGHTVTLLNAQEAVETKKTSIIYADPPYTKRQYAAYYHVLETIVKYDEPELSGTTGLRDWKTHSSEFCYKNRAEHALERILLAADCEHFFLSYSEDGQMPHSRIIDLLATFGNVKFSELELKRYRSSNLPHKGPTVPERLYHLRKK